MRSAYLSALSTIAPGVAADWCGLGAAPPLGEEAVATRRRAAVGSATDWFDAKRALPGIRHRYLTDATRFSLAVALRCRQLAPQDAPAQRRGLFVGTSIADQTVRWNFDRTAIDAGAAGLNTVAAPNMSANIVAAHVAIACNGRAFSTTLTSAALAGFESLFLGIQALAIGRADQVLCLATEDAANGERVLPGALALQIDASPSDARRRVQAVAWGRARPVGSAAVQRLAQAAQALPPAQRRGARIVRILEASKRTQATADQCLQALSGLGLPHTDCCVAGIGSFEPLLCAAPWMTAEQPVLLLAVHQRRFLAFLVLPPTSTERFLP